MTGGDDHRGRHRGGQLQGTLADDRQGHARLGDHAAAGGAAGICGVAFNKGWSQGLGKRVGKSKDGGLGRVDALYFSSQSGIDPYRRGFVAGAMMLFYARRWRRRRRGNCISPGMVNRKKHLSAIA